MAAGKEAVAILRDGEAAGRLKLAPKEKTWLRRIEGELSSLPESQEELMSEMTEHYGEFFSADSYGL